MRQLVPFAWLLLAHTSLCFEFVIDGEWEDGEPVAISGEPLQEIERMKRSLSNGDEEPETGITGDGIVVRSYRVESQITSRFAHTTIRSLVVNSAKESQNIAFNMQIPKHAFINNFTMNVNGIVFIGSVMEKTVARKLYSQARARGKAAGIVRSSIPDMETFKTEVHVPPGSTIEFELHYQEMLQRRQGIYEHALYLQPGRLVPHLQVDVYIYEPKGISFIETPDSLGEKFNKLTKVTNSKDKATIAPLQAHVIFKPTLEEQKKCENCSSTAIDGIFLVRYDVQRDNNAGELQVSDGHFVLFFAPTNLTPLPKNIVFVIDVSGSMWGLKMKQMVEAMQTILDDLTVDDYFSIIDFNHNVRCWSEELVPGNSIQVSEAKNYIKAIKPSGGTNINEGLLRAIHMLTRAANQGLLHPRSVSMIILVSDGDPTVGEIKLSNIQKNIKRVMREEFSLFSLGIGFDVDFDFLERIAIENRGIAQRIYATHEASGQLRNFYNQVSSPLLRKINIQFPEDTVTDITQSRFDKFFSGSELVVAGKVQSCTGATLQSFTTAFSKQMDLSLQTETDCSELDTILSQQSHSFAGFARQMWAYMTINQLLAERSLASTSAKKRRITQKILNLAVTHKFVTPLTAMLVEGDNGQERLLADSPKDPRQGCCTGTTSVNGRTTSQLVYGNPPWAPMTTPSTLSQAKGPSVTMVEGDPHFIVHFPKSNTDVCFNINSEPGHILNLVSDSDLGIAVNGLLISGKKPKDGKLNTYFGTITVFYKPLAVRVDISTDKIMVFDGENLNSFTWAATADITFGSISVSIEKDTKVTVSINENLSFMVLLHRVWKKHMYNVDFLGIYIPTDNVYTAQVHGLIGQFSVAPEVKVYNIHNGSDPLKKVATMDVKGNKLFVTRGWQKDYRKNVKNGSDVFCWFIHNSGKGFIDGHFKNYIVPQMDSFLQKE